VVEADSINSFKCRLDKYWTNQDVIYNYDCDLTGIATSLYVIYCHLRCGQRGTNCARHITLDWIGWIVNPAVKLQYSQ